ncbi:type II toxin-antitoxin system HigB family toxin [Nostoc sp. FACHB-892]
MIRWFKLMNSAKFQTFEELGSVFPSADLVGNLIVFNIGGNKYRLITSIHFNRQKVYIRDILTHSEYNKDQWKT